MSSHLSDPTVPPNRRPYASASLYRGLFPQSPNINKIVYIICWAGLENITPVAGMVQLLPNDIVTQICGATPWKLRVGELTARTLPQILALNAGNAATYGWRYVAAGPPPPATATTAYDDGNNGNDGADSDADDGGEDVSIASELMIEASGEAGEECSGCIHDFVL
jgi:hypothetical protein